jgi:hypothetical protein
MSFGPMNWMLLLLEEEAGEEWVVSRVVIVVEVDQQMSINKDAS